MKRIATLLAGFTALTAAGQAGAENETVRTISVWARGAGPLELDGRPRPAREIKLEPGALRPGKARRTDAQLGEARDLQGVPLRAILERFAPEPRLDLALLHFANGMAVPLPFRDAAAMKRLDPWLAIGSFAPIRAKGQPPEARPITFAGNKIVVAERWHPAVPEGAREFSPWDHVDSLVGIELVEAAPYWAQFDVSAEPKVQQGLALVRQTCAFCHGARKIGAKLGWDLVEPYPLYSYRRPDTRLYYHIAYNPWNAAEKGLRMPALKFMTKEDAAAVWQWLKAIAEKPMPAYAPTAQAGRRRP